MAKCKTIAETKLMARWHQTKNNKLDPTVITVGSSRTAWWRCQDCNHEWPSKISNQFRSKTKNGCPSCYGFFNDSLTKTHPHIAKEWHPTKNGSLTPCDITAGCKKYVWWKCDVADDHEWQARPNDRTTPSHKSGCLCCRRLKVVKSNCLATTHPHIAKEWHPTKNGSLTPCDITAGSKVMVWWKCDVADDHEWQAVPSRRTNPSESNDCPCCSGHKTVASNCLAKLRPNIAEEWHPTKNGSLTPHNVVVCSMKKVWWLCSKNKKHQWSAAISNRTSGRTNCPFCKNVKGEDKIAEILSTKNILFDRQVKFAECKRKRELPFDFRVFVNNKEHLIEYQGEDHYYVFSRGSKKPYAKYSKLINRIESDNIKLNWCERNNVSVLVIPYWDYDRIEEILTDFFAGRDPIFSEPPDKVKKYQPMRQKILERLKARSQ